MTRGNRTWGAALALVTGTVALVSGPVPSAAAGTSQGTSSAAVHWYQGVLADLRPLQSPLVSGLRAASSWQQGTETASAAAHELRKDIPRLAQVQRRLSRLSPLPGHRGSDDDYVAAIGLYLDAFRLELAATGVGGGPLAAQLQHSFGRIRELGDLTFDQGTAALAPFLGAAIAGPDVQAASHVPDWSALGLAPGPPLVSTWPGVSGTTSSAGATTDWATAVRQDGAPSQAAVQRALRNPSIRADGLAAMALALGRANVALAGASGPTSPVQTAALARLGLLVDAEGVLSDVAGRHAGSQRRTELERVGTDLGRIGGVLRAASGTAH